MNDDFDNAQADAEMLERCQEAENADAAPHPFALLKELAEHATPGPWLPVPTWRNVKWCSHWGVTTEKFPTIPTVVHAQTSYDGFGNGSSEVNARYIAAADPTTVKALLLRLEAVEFALRGLYSVHAEVQMDTPDDIDLQRRVLEGVRELAGAVGVEIE